MEDKLLVLNALLSCIKHLKCTDEEIFQNIFKHNFDVTYGYIISEYEKVLNSKKYTN